MTEKKPWHRMSREEVMGRLDDYQAKRRADRRRLTGDDVQEMLRERRAERRRLKRERKAQRANGPKARRDVGRTMRSSLGWALLAGVVGIGSLAVSSTDTAQERFEDNERTILLLTGEIRALEENTWDEAEASGLEERLEQALEQAREKGEHIARAQNTYQELLVDTNGTEPPEGGEASEAFAAVGEHREELVDLFDDSARIIKDEESYHPGADRFYGPGEIDVLSPWYIRYSDENRGTYAKASLNSWELVAVSLSDSPDSIHVSWLNQEASTGDLLAWARATYDIHTEVFHSLYVGQTTIGDRPVDVPDQE
ncbi:hypothetical protein [Nocardiopsis alkaliphila]|uniref:hypothetical protein n=1 Tax=Nocardiopsis alkaliphila TaxID=225762 RepID=UPI00034AC17A|nr:hypothetical protein [Nocardiopsis alkaliphila]